MPLSPFVVAHRGASIAYPENTLIGFQAAIELGVDCIELDVVTTSNGAVIVSHDTTADRCTSGTGNFKEMTFEQVQALDAGVKFGQQFTGERIPRLEEVLGLVEHTSVQLCIEIKGDSVEGFLSNARAAVTLLQRADALRYCSIASFDPNCLQAIRTWEPLLAVNLDPEPQDGSLTPWELVQQCLRCGANFMGHTYRTLTPAIVHEAHSHGMGLWVWTVNDAATMRDMLKMGVDAILSDDPALLKTVLAER